jgi:hypothetical protein
MELGSWFVHASAASIDTRLERDAAKARDLEAWSLLMSRLADAVIEPDETLREDKIAAAPDLGFFRSRKEAMVYRLIGNPKRRPQVLIIANVNSATDEGLLIAEAQRRNAL